MAKLSVADAAAQWIRAKKAIAKEQTRLDAAKRVLLEHFRKSGKRTYKDQIAYSVSTRTVLDQEAVKAELGDRLPRFQKTTEVESLSLLT